MLVIFTGIANPIKNSFSPLKTHLVDNQTMDSLYQTVTADRFQRLTALQGAAGFNSLVLKIFTLDFFQGSLLKSVFPQCQ